jgi:hypothetical protein
MIAGFGSVKNVWSNLKRYDILKKKQILTQVGSGSV